MRIEDTLKIFGFDTTQFTSSFEIKPEENVMLFSVLQKENTDTFEPVITPQGVKDKSVLENAPKPDIVIAGVKKKAGIVVDISKNILYRYDKNGNPVNAYLIASGKKNTPTQKGIRVVTHKEKYPYRQ